MKPEDRRRRRRVWPAVGACCAAYAALLAALAFGAGRSCDGRGAAAVLLFTEPALMAGAVVCLASAASRRGLRVVGLLAAVLAGLAAMAILSAAVVWLAARGAYGVGVVLCAQLVFVAFGLLLAGLLVALRRAGGEPLAAQLVTLCVAAALVGTVFYADPIVEGRGSPEARRRVIRAALAVNPLTAVSGSLLEVDLMRRRVMYDKISVIGRWYQVPYPRWWTTACGYGVAAVALFGAAALFEAFARRRRKEGAAV